MYNIHQNAYTARIRTIRVPKKNPTHTHSSWQRVVKCCLAIYFVFINLLISVACCQSLIFVSSRWTSLRFLWPLCALHINIKMAQIMVFESALFGYSIFLPFVWVCFTALLFSFYLLSKKYRHQFALMPDVCT